MFPNLDDSQGGPLVGKEARRGGALRYGGDHLASYLVLALRKQKKGRALLHEHYTSQALMWRREAINLLAQATSATA